MSTLAPATNTADTLLPGASDAELPNNIDAMMLGTSPGIKAMHNLRLPLDLVTFLSQFRVAGNRLGSRRQIVFCLDRYCDAQPGDPAVERRTKRIRSIMEMVSDNAVIQGPALEFMDETSIEDARLTEIEATIDRTTIDTLKPGLAEYTARQTAVVLRSLDGHENAAKFGWVNSAKHVDVKQREKGMVAKGGEKEFDVHLVNQERTGQPVQGIYVATRRLLYEKGASRAPYLSLDKDNASNTIFIPESADDIGTEVEKVTPSMIANTYWMLLRTVDVINGDTTPDTLLEPRLHFPSATQLKKTIEQADLAALEDSKVVIKKAGQRTETVERRKYEQARRAIDASAEALIEAAKSQAMKEAEKIEAKREKPDIPLLRDKLGAALEKLTSIAT